MRWTYGWSWSCPENTPLKDRGSDLVLNDMTDIVSANAESQHVAGDKTFIADFDKSIDYCMNPDLMSLVSGFAACGLSSFSFSLFLFFSLAEKSQHHILLSEQHRAAVNLVPALVTCRVCPQSSNIDQFPRNASDVYTLCLFFSFSDQMEL